MSWDQCLECPHVTCECLTHLSTCVLKNLPMFGEKGLIVGLSRICDWNVCEHVPEKCVPLCWAMVGDAFHLKTRSRNMVWEPAFCYMTPVRMGQNQAFTFATWQYLSVFLYARFALGHACVQLLQSITQKVFLRTQK